MSIRTFSLVFSAALILAAQSMVSHAGEYDGSCMDAPTIPSPAGNVVSVNSESELQQAMNSLSENTVVLLAPGEYRLTNTLWVNNRDNITIRGDSSRCDEVVLIGKGMENAAGVSTVPHGIWTNANNLKVQNLTIKEVYYHAVSIDSNSDSPEIYNVAMLDIGEQFVKASSGGFGNGADFGRVEYSVMKYLSNPPLTDHGGGTGYTNGVDVHGGTNWIISNNRFENFHTADNAQHLWNPAILMWNGASDTRVENNTFIDVDRAIAFGLADRNNDHSGGIILNNMISMSSGLYSASRKLNSDGTIILWSSPGTKVLHNTVLTRDNTNKSIELRFNSNGAVVKNNLVTARISDRSGNSYVDSGNVQISDFGIFVDADAGDLHLSSTVSGITDSAEALPDVTVDFDGDARGGGHLADVGADEIRSAGVCRF